MSKPALGRGLGSLLSGSATPRRGIPTSTAPASRVGPGVAVLITGDRLTGPGERLADGVNSTSEIDRTSQRHRVRWMLVVADLGLCGMAAVLLLRQSVPVRPEEIALGISGILVGAWLGCGAVIFGDPPTNGKQT